MTPVTQWLHTQHEAFHPHVAHLRLLAAPQEHCSVVAWCAALDDSCAFLQQELAPYLYVVEQVLYPLLEYMLECPQAMASLRSANGELRQRSELLLTLRAALSREPVSPPSALHVLVATLYTRVTAYFTEEALYLACLDTKVTPGAAHGLAIALEMVYTMLKVEGKVSRHGWNPGALDSLCLP